MARAAGFASGDPCVKGKLGEHGRASPRITLGLGALGHRAGGSHAGGRLRVVCAGHHRGSKSDCAKKQGNCAKPPPRSAPRRDRACLSGRCVVQIGHVAPAIPLHPGLPDRPPDGLVPGLSAHPGRNRRLADADRGRTARPAGRAAPPRVIRPRPDQQRPQRGAAPLAGSGLAGSGLAGSGLAGSGLAGSGRRDQSGARSSARCRKRL